RGRFVMALLTWLLVSLLAVYLVVVFGLTVFQRRLQYFPDRPVTELAQTSMIGGEELRLATADRLSLPGGDRANVTPKSLAESSRFGSHGPVAVRRIHGLLADCKWRYRTFRASRYHLSGFTDDELRKNCGASGVADGRRAGSLGTYV